MAVEAEAGGGGADCICREAGKLAAGGCCPQAVVVPHERGSLRSSPRRSPAGARRPQHKEAGGVLGLGGAIISSWPSSRDPQQMPHGDCPKQGKHTSCPSDCSFGRGWAVPHMPTSAPLQASARPASTLRPPGSPGSCSSASWFECRLEARALSTVRTALRPSWKLLEKAPASCSKEDSSGRHLVCIRLSEIQVPPPKAATWKTHPILLCALPASLSPHPFPSAFWGHLPNKLLTPKSLPQALLWGKTRPGLRDLLRLPPKKKSRL